MRARYFHFVWGMVICLTAVMVGLLPGSESPQRINRQDLIEQERFPESPVVVIGSSLMRNAVPAYGSATDSLLAVSGKSCDHVVYQEHLSMITPLARGLARILPAWAVAPSLVLIYCASVLLILLLIGQQHHGNPYMDVGVNR